MGPCAWITGAERHGAFLISRDAFEGKNATDRTYNVNVEFVMSGTATPGNGGFSGDYHLTLNPNGGVPTDMISVDANGKGTATIPAGSNEVIVYVMPNGDYIFEADETAILTVSKAYAEEENPDVAANLFEIDPVETGGTVTILQAPEFVSDADPPPVPNPLPVNGDTYHVTKLLLKSNIDKDRSEDRGVKDNLAAANNRGVRYSFSDGALLDGNFVIDAGSGKISFKESTAIVAGLFSLQVKAYDPEYVMLYDLATVNINIAIAEIQAGFAGNSIHSVNTMTKDSTNTMVVGQKIDVKLVITGNIFVSDVHWSITGDIVRGYTVSPSSGVVTDFLQAHAQGQQTYYYYKGIDQSSNITCAFSALGNNYEEKTTLYIERPGYLFDSQWTDITPAVDIRKRSPDHDYDELILGNRVSPGITFGGTVGMSEGQVAIQQIADVFVYETYDNGAKPKKYSPAGPLRDGLASNTFYAGPSSTLSSISNYLYLETRDTPGSPLNGGKKTVIRRGDFKTYLQYKAAGDSIWVTLSLIEWGWYGHAYKDASGKWKTTIDTRKYGGGEGTDCTDLPVWRNYHKINDPNEWTVVQ